jgi:hypothetical protein
VCCFFGWRRWGEALTAAVLLRASGRRRSVVRARKSALTSASASKNTRGGLAWPGTELATPGSPAMRSINGSAPPVLAASGADVKVTLAVANPVSGAIAAAAIAAAAAPAPAAAPAAAATWTLASLPGEVPRFTRSDGSAAAALPAGDIAVDASGAPLRLGADGAIVFLHAPGPEGKPLRAGWKRASDEEGDVWFVNEATGESLWDAPLAEQV